MAVWSGHWHGFGWSGYAGPYFKEFKRRPGPSLESKHAREFLASPLPPMMTGHWLLKASMAHPDQTWTTPDDAVAWLCRQHEETPPDTALTYVPLESCIPRWRERLPSGGDVTLAHWASGNRLASFSVVCCPNRFHPDLPCPFVDLGIWGAKTHA